MSGICYFMCKGADRFEFIASRHESIVFYKARIHALVVRHLPQYFEPHFLEGLDLRVLNVVNKVGAIECRYIALGPECRFELSPEIFLNGYWLYKVAHIRGKV